MNHVCFPVPVVQLLRRLFNVVSSLTVSNQYYLVKKAEWEAESRNNLLDGSGTRSRAQVNLLNLSGSHNCPVSRYGRCVPSGHQKNSMMMSTSLQEANAVPSTGAVDLPPSPKQPLRDKPVFPRESASPDTPPTNHDRSKDIQPPTLNAHQATIQQLMSLPTLFDPVRTPRYPLVLCHGLYGFDVRGPASFPRLQLHYWGNILRILRRTVGAEVIVTGVPPTGSIASRAESMDRYLKETARGQAINFIAHSMGGLDGRHLITHCEPQDYTPLSLTTISTPHQGSPFMDWCADNLGLGKTREDMTRRQRENKDVLEATSSTGPTKSAQPSTGFQFSLASLPSSFTTLLLSVLDSPAYSNLTTSYLTKVFNPATPNMPHVKYYSVAARTEGINVWHPLWLPKMVLDNAEEKERAELKKSNPSSPLLNSGEWGNDGLVSIRSAKWGEFLGILENCDHWDVRGSRGLGLDAVDGLSLMPNSLSEAWNIGDWGRFVRAWSREEKRQQRQEGVVVEGPQEDRDKANEEILKSSTDKLSAVFDWIVEQIPVSTKSDASTPKNVKIDADKRKDVPKVDKFDIERFYIALTRKLYEDGL